MNRVCDICGDAKTELKIDADGLWICTSCQKRVKSAPVGDETAVDMAPELQALVGKSAGAICRTLELPVEPPYDVIIEAASAIGYDQDRYMSAWLFVTQWLDSTTVWRDPEGIATAQVTSDGKVEILYNR